MTSCKSGLQRRHHEALLLCFRDGLMFLRAGQSAVAASMQGGGGQTPELISPSAAESSAIGR